MSVPETTSAEAFWRYAGGECLYQAGGDAWRDVKAWIVALPPIVDTLHLPSVSEPFLAWTTSGEIDFQERENGHPWTTNRIRKDSFFLTTGGAPYDVRWKAVTTEPFQAMYVFVELPVLQRAFDEVFGAGAVFTLNGLSFLAVVYALASWKRQQALSNLPSEELITAVKAGFRYLLYSPLLQNLVVRTGIFMLFASAFWGLFPSLARFNFHATATGFGFLYGFLGVGAVIGATVVPLFQEKFSIDRGIVFTTCLYALGTAMLVFLRHIAFAYLAMVLIGFAWIVTVSTFNVFVQSIVAGWVKARAIGVYMLIFQGALAVGSLLWGALASQFTVTSAFGVAIIGLILTSTGAFLWPLRTEKPLNVEYSFHWPQADVLPDIHHERGPVMVSLGYEVEPKNQPAFLEAILKLKNMRLRDGAIRWGVFRDTEKANRFVENFIVQSWGEHVRQHARPTFTDKELEDEVFKFNKGGRPPVTTHYIAEGYS